MSFCIKNSNEKVSKGSKVQSKDKKKLRGRLFLKALKNILPCTRKAIRTNFDIGDDASMDFASPNMKVTLSPKRAGVNAREQPTEYDQLPVLNCDIEEYQTLRARVCKRERRFAAIIPDAEYAQPNLAEAYHRGDEPSFNEPDFYPAFTTGVQNDRCMGVDRKRIKRYARQFEVEVTAAAVESAIHVELEAAREEVKDADDVSEIKAPSEIGTDKIYYDQDVHEKLASYGIVYFEVPGELPSKPYGVISARGERDPSPRGYPRFEPSKPLESVEELDEELDTQSTAPLVDTPVLDSVDEGIDTQSSTPAVETPVLESANEVAFVVAGRPASPAEEQGRAVDHRSAVHLTTVSDEKHDRVDEALRQVNEGL
ncbi:hypothetical protein CPC08DRAFT_761918 [Agrocybe pediades]|nr:hypothetical protein CPC08DRAFT_761918 [Agrocybe pediades]